MLDSREIRIPSYRGITITSHIDVDQAGALTHHFQFESMYRDDSKVSILSTLDDASGAYYEGTPNPVVWAFTKQVHAKTSETHPEQRGIEATGRGSATIIVGGGSRVPGAQPEGLVYLLEFDV